jgi:hypothetical protein
MLIACAKTGARADPISRAIRRRAAEIARDARLCDGDCMLRP